MTIDTPTLLIVLGVAAAVALMLVLVVRGRRQRVALSDPAPVALERRTFAPVPARQGDGIDDRAAVAAEAVSGEPGGSDARQEPASAPADPLTQLKGLGPKAAAQLNALGIARFEQLAALDRDQVAAIDAAMGNFRGRILRDQWVEQAGYLAAGDRAGFEARFGKLG